MFSDRDPAEVVKRLRLRAKPRRRTPGLLVVEEASLVPRQRNALTSFLD